MADLFGYLQQQFTRATKPTERDNLLFKSLYTSFYSPFTPITPTTNQTADLVTGYMDNETVYSIVNKIAETASHVPINLVDKNGDVIESHWINDLLENPNADNSFKEILFNYYVYLLSIGNSYIYTPKMARNQVSELWTMPSDLVNVVSGPFYEPVKGYKLIEGNQEIIFEKETVMHGKLFNPRFQGGSWVYGLSPITVASEILSYMESGNLSMENAFKNGGPPYIITSQTPEGLTQQQQEMLEASYKKKYQGSNNANNPMLTGTPVDVKMLGVSPVDLNIIESSKHGLRVLCNVYGVSSILFNDNDSSTYNNVSQARKDFYQYTIQPLNQAFADKFIKILTDEDVYLKFDYSEIEVLQESIYTRIKSLETADFLSVNEKRTAAGYAELEGKEYDEINTTPKPTEFQSVYEEGNDL